LSSLHISKVYNCFADWTLTAVGGDDKISVYADLSTKKYVGGYIRIWSLTNTTKSGEKFRSFKSFEEYDCTQDRKRIIQITAYSGQMGTGNVLGTEKNGGWDFVTPGSVDAVHLKKICSK